MPTGAKCFASGFAPSHQDGFCLCYRLFMSLRKLLTGLRLLAATLFLFALAQAADPPDTLTLTNGEKLIGKIVRATGASVTFHSDSGGHLTIPWAKIKELTSSRRFAVIPKGIQLHRKDAEAKIPRGTIALADGKIQITQTG